MTSDNDYILVVDDERAIREMICMALVQEDLLCTEASDAHKAEVMIKKKNLSLFCLTG
jgi:DNA-binding response OmpR family regulator